MNTNTNATYENNFKRSTLDTVKGELKQGIFFYVITVILSKLIAYVVTGIILIITLIARKIYQATLSNEEKEANSREVALYYKGMEEREKFERDVQAVATMKDMAERGN